MIKLLDILTEDYKIANIKLEQDGGSEEKAFDKEFSRAANDIAIALGNELKAKDKKDLNEAILLTAISAIMTANAVVGLISKYSAKLFKLLNFKKGEDIAEKIHHWAHDNEMAFQSPIKRVLGFFVKDAKTLDILTKAIYAIVVGTMAAGYGAQVINKLSNADWFSSALGALKTVAKADETIVNSYPAIKSLIG